MIRLIIFDLDGVVIDFSWRQYIDYKSKILGVNSKTFADTFSPLKEEWDLGKITLSELESSLAHKLGAKKKENGVLNGFKKFGKQNKDIRKLIFSLSNKYKIGAITNVGSSRFKIEKRSYLNDLPLNGIVASCYLKVKKPDPRIYMYALRRFRASPKEVVFIDDTEENVIAARKLGITSIVFNNPAQLLSGLEKYNIKP